MVEEQKGPPSGTPTTSGTPPAINLEEVDNLLNELDPEFRAQLGNLPFEIGTLSPVTGLESVTLSADYLKDSTEAKSDEDLAVPAAEPPIEFKDAPDKDRGFIAILFAVAVSTFKLFFFLFRLSLEMAKVARKTSLGGALKEATAEINAPFVEWLGSFRKIFRKLQSYSFTTYIKLGLIVALLFGIRFVVTDMKNHIRPDGSRDPFLKNWSEVSDLVKEIPAEEREDTVDDPLRHPEYTVLIHRIVSNLKALTPKRTPMVTSELYIEASNQDCAVELHDRELEVRDALERVFEETTFDELDTSAGKEKEKVRIRTALNKFLTKGHVKRVFFSSLNMVP